MNSPVELLFSSLQKSPQEPISGLNGALGAMALARLARNPFVHVVVVPTPERARRLADETRLWLDPRSPRIAAFLPDQHSIYDQTGVDSSVAHGRLTALDMELCGGGLVIVPVQALAERFSDPGRRRQLAFSLQQGGFFIRDQLVRQLARLGYRRETVVEEPGKFAVRGSLIDVYPVNAELPLRLDFFGDELESIKTFSPETQRTIEKIPSFTVGPGLETLPDEADVTALIRAVELAAHELDTMRGELLCRRMERLIAGPDSRDLRELQPFRRTAVGFLTDHWPTARVFIEMPEQCREELASFLQEQETLFDGLEELTPLRPPSVYYHSVDAVFETLRTRHAATLSRFRETGDAGCVFDIRPHAPPSDPSRESLLKDLRRLLEDKWAIAIVLTDGERFHNLKGLLGERKYPLHTSRDPFGLKPGSVLMLLGPAQRGFFADAAKVAVYAEEDIFGTIARPVSKSRSRAPGSMLPLSQLVPGDLVVHVDHGIAEYRGIKVMTAAGLEREYLELQYAGADRLYVPTDQCHKVHKYIGMEGSRPAIHSLNSKVWENQRRRVQKNVEAIARDLLELYAKRQASSGFAYPPDGELQAIMETKFPFKETPDQARAIIATKEDMETDMPMDRLICGDVGYGKTEVAMRAAFKAVCAGKQVAVLSPTTLLAFQHYQTFSTRFSEFPVRIGMVSRLVKAQQQKAILQKVKAGTIDILIGTHRILSADVAFKDLGLVVVDEEQRFGVQHKEKFKRLRAAVDVLTLTATPIPRTLQMALSGIRQISIIDTPPEDRLPIHTYVAPFDGGWAKRAILDELRRGGQVYYVFNRVERMDRKMAFLRELVPEARIVSAHGQMDEGVVERTMLAFINREYDVLLATTIIESGLDIPNVNTLIVDEAERLGLGQMYQLRGRVGRSARQAWAYFFYSKGKRLTQEAQERLATIEEHTALGSGFKIALRDLQIRGAGSVLGEEQSGHISTVGFALYVELLEEAVKRVRGERIVRAPDAAIEIPVTALLPKSYVPEEETRIELYSRLSRCSDVDLLDLVKAEIEDRFGPMPDEAKRLVRVARLKAGATLAGVVKITRVLNRLRVEFDPKRALNASALLDARAAFFKQITLTPQDPNAVQLQLGNLTGDDVLTVAEDFIEHVRKSGADDARLN
ncbi:MAG: transcription-repair coupling factor [Candidatus Ozemobacteraceae bacterium]